MNEEWQPPTSMQKKLRSPGRGMQEFSIQGHRLKEYAITMTFLREEQERQWHYVNSIVAQVSKMEHTYSSQRGQRNGWNTFSAVVNGVPRPACRVGEFMIVDFGRREDFTRMQRWGYFLARMLLGGRARKPLKKWGQ